MTKALLITLTLMGAWPAHADPDEMLLGFGSYASTPVIITGFRLNDRQPIHFPMLENSEVDQLRPRVGSGRYALAYPKGADDQRLRIKAEWVELLSNRAWQAELDVEIARLDRARPDQVALMPVFGPNGEFLITSDPVPDPAGKVILNDVLRTCGSRNPAKDHDYRAAPSAIAGLAEALSFTYPPASDPACPAPKD